MSPARIRSGVLVQAVASLSALDGVDAIYLSGSLAEKTEDQYSDIDLRVVVADVAYESVRALREQLPRTWGPFLFHQTVADDLTVTYYESLTKADVFYFPASAVKPSPWFNLGTTILFERRDALRFAIQASEGLAFSGTPDEVICHLQKSIAGLTESAKRACRGENIYATRLSADAIHNLLVADDLMSGRAALGSSKRELLVPAPLTDLLKDHLAIPAPAERSKHYSALSSAVVDVLDKAVAAGFCRNDTATQLRRALEQLRQLLTDNC